MSTDKKDMIAGIRAAMEAKLALTGETLEERGVKPQADAIEQEKSQNIPQGVTVSGKGLNDGFLRLVNTCVEDAVITIGHKGIYTRVVDPSHVAMVEVSMNQTTPDESIPPIGIELGNIQSAIARRKLWSKKDKHMVTLFHDESKGTLQITLDNGHVFNQRLLDASNLTPPNIPGLDFPVSIECDRIEFLDALCSARTVGDLVKLRHDSATSTLKVVCAGETHSFEAVIESAQPIINNNGEGQYSLTYLLPFLKAINCKGDAIRVNMGVNLPLRLEGEYECGGDTISWTYFLAPRIEGDV